jgi:putative aldouronate transport system substrate-binding protein
MKKTLSILLACFMMLTLLAACTPDNSTPSAQDSTKAPDSTAPSTPADDAEIVDGKFVKTRKITVEIYDRGNDGGSLPEDNFYTDYIKEGMLRDHNVEVTYVPVPRWTETDVLNNLLAASDAPDICVTYSYDTIQTYANMGGVYDLEPLLEENKAMLTNLWDLLGDTNIYYNQDPITGKIWAIEAIRAQIPRVTTFAREDWLSKLSIAEPTNIEEFENMIYKFKDNASTLLGADADKIIPFSVSFDVGWTASNLMMSFVPDATSDKDFYIYGFDDRGLQWPGVKEGIRKLNEWYNAGLMWDDFALYKEGDTTEANMMKAGYVGSMMQNWDNPYRDADQGVHGNLQRLGSECAYIAIDPFPNDAGKYKKLTYSSVDRKVFFPSTNKEPVASLLYLDWISKLENRRFLQIGEEGVTHEVMPDGAIKTIAATGDKIMNSGNNIDYTITINGLDLGDPDLTTRSLALGYAGVDARFIQKAFDTAMNDGFSPKHFNCGEIKAETGMGQVLKEKRDILLAQAVICSTSDFDAVWDAGYQDYLDSGAQAIIDERRAAYEKYYE